MRTGTASPVSRDSSADRPVCLKQPRVGWHPVAFGQHDQIAAHHLSPGDPQPFSAPDHQGARAGQIAQRLQHTFGPRLLHHGDADRQAGKGQQDQRLFEVAKQKIDDAPRDQQRQHRLSQDLEHDPQGGSATCARQFVEAIGGKPRLGLGLGQTLDATGLRSSLL